MDPSSQNIRPSVGLRGRWISSFDTRVDWRGSTSLNGSYKTVGLSLTYDVGRGTCVQCPDMEYLQGPECET